MQPEEGEGLALAVRRRTHGEGVEFFNVAAASSL